MKIDKTDGEKSYIYIKWPKGKKKIRMKNVEEMVVKAKAKD